MSQDARWAAAMAAALGAARECLAEGDVPVGAVLLDASDQIVATGRNRREATGDPTAHAELVALRGGWPGGGWRRSGGTLVVTLEPCVMCAGAIVAARLSRCVFGAWDEKAGAGGSVWDLMRDPLALHRVETVGGVREAECRALLRDFFASRR